MKCRDVLRRRRAEARAPIAECSVCGETGRLSHRAGKISVCSKRCQSTVYGRLSRASRNFKAEAERRRRLLGTSLTCERCGQGYVVKRSDQRFCSKPCAERWYHHNGPKGEHRRAKRCKELAERSAAIGSCVLCGVRHDRIVPASELGSRGRNGVALFHRDHIIPRAHGGTDDESNLRYLCWFCNTARMTIDAIHDGAIAAAGKAFWSNISQPGE